MNKRFINYINDHDLCGKSDLLLLAVSGGIDSVAMAALFHNNGFRFGIAHCNFGLRGIESDEDERFVTILAEKYGVPLHIKRFRTTDYSKQHGISIQMAARELRYSWFEELCIQHQYNRIATAHHLDDQVETFFINLIRGTGISGLHGIRVKQGNVIRPLMFTYRDEIDEFARANHLHYRSDSSNATTKYLRNKIRHELIPLLSEMNPDFSHQLTSTIHRINDIEFIADQAIRGWKGKVMKRSGDDIFIDIPLFLHANPMMTLAWELLSPYGFNQSQVDDIVRCLEKEKSQVFLSPTHRLVKNRLQLIIQPFSEKKEKKSFRINEFSKHKSLKTPIPLFLKKISHSPNYEIPVSANMASIACERIEFPLILRKWEPGDSFRPYGLNRKKKLSDFFIDLKFSIPDKEKCWLLCSGKHIVWVVGHRIDHQFRVTPKTKQILQIEAKT